MIIRVTINKGYINGFFCRMFSGSSLDSEFSLQDVVRCALCEIPAPSLHCEFCQINLCKACGEQHVLDESKTHKVVVIERPELPHYPKCIIHVNKQCLLHCKQCNLSLCTLCLPLEEHKEHNIVDIFEIFEQKRDSLQSDLTELEEIILPKFQNFATDVPVKKVDIERNSKKLKLSICKRGEKMHKQIDLIMNELKTEITVTRSKQIAALMEIDKDIKQSISEIEKTILYIKNLQDSNDVSLTSAYKSKNSEFRRYSPKTDVSFSNFSAPKIKSEKLHRLFGSLSEITSKKQNITPSVPLAETSVGEYLHGEFKVSTSITTRYGGFLKELLSVTCLNDDEIWTCGNRPTLSLYNLRGELKRSIETTSGNTPRDVAVTKSGDLVYSDFVDKTVTIVKNAQKPIRNVIRLDGWKPCNLCSTSSDDLLVSVESDDQKQTKIVRFSGASSKPYINIQFDDNGRPLFSHGGYDKAINENRNLDICMADFGAGELVVVDQNGKLRFRYTGFALINNAKKSYHPRGVTTDSQSRILTSDYYNHCIHILDQNGQLLRHIDNCKLQRPWGLCVDTRDNLFVVEFFSGKVKKIQYYRE